jgi:hypothetical protein
MRRNGLEKVLVRQKSLRTRRINLSLMLYDGRRHGFIQIVSEFLSTNGELRFGEKFLPTSEENNIFAKKINP